MVLLDWFGWLGFAYSVKFGYLGCVLGSDWIVVCVYFLFGVVFGVLPA